MRKIESTFSVEEEQNQMSQAMNIIKGSLIENVSVFECWHVFWIKYKCFQLGILH